MRVILLGAFLFSAIGCGQKTFEEAFSAGKIDWQPVKNVQLTSRSGQTETVESFDFVTKLKYDDSGRSSEDTTGQKKYSWTDREAIFGPDAVIRITEETTVREGLIHAGDEWIWTGENWKASPK
jgi:hypothetical protein